MTGHGLVNLFYSVNLHWLDNSSLSDSERMHLTLFLLGLIETVYIMDPYKIALNIPEFLNAN